MPVRMAAGKRQMVRTVMMRNPKMASRIAGDVKWPGRTGAPGEPMVTMPV
jgi:hypothetical protein